MNVTFYTFGKKDNSTARPSGGTSHNCVLKDETGVLSPVIKLAPTIGNPSSYNYAYISTFGRYYYVREWTFNRGEWEAALEVDVLASWKTSIGSTSAYILRSSTTTHWNKEIVDNKYPAESTTHHVKTEIEFNKGPWNSFGYVIGTIGDNTNSGVAAYGGVNYYCVDQPLATQIFQWLTGHGVGSYLDDLNTAFHNFADDAFLATYDPVQYITSVKFFPFSMASLSTASEFVIGKLSYNMFNLHTCLYPAIDRGPYTLTIPKHPAASTRGEYLCTAPYSVYVFELQPYGRIELDGSMLAQASTLSFTIQVDLVSGDSLLFLSATGPNSYSCSLGVYPGKVGTNIQISQITSNIVQNAVTESIRAAGAAASDNWFGVASAAISAGTDSKFQATVKGSEGSFLISDMVSSPKLHLYYKNVAAEDKSHFGVPICENHLISDEPGYVICAEGDVAAAATKPELDQIRAHMTAGFYYE